MIEMADFNFKLPDISNQMLDVRGIKAMNEEYIQRQAEKSAAEYQANIETIEQSKTLREIADNTAYLKDLVLITREIKLNGDESNLISKAIYNISNAESKEDAANKLSEALAKLSSSGEFVGNMSNIVSFLTGLYNTVSSMV